VTIFLASLNLLLNLIHPNLMIDYFLILMSQMNRKNYFSS
jgi:hypothetical protein